MTKAQEIAVQIAYAESWRYPEDHVLTDIERDLLADLIAENLLAYGREREEAAHKALADLIAIRPENWEDDDDPEQAEAWRRAQKVVDEGYDRVRALPITETSDG